MNAIHGLANAFVRLDPLTPEHVEPLAAAAAEKPAEYALAPVPVDVAGMRAYVHAALADAAANRALPFAIVRQDGNVGNVGKHGTVVGSTRFMNLEWWSWPPGPIRVAGEPRRLDAGAPPDVVEIGHAWLAASAIRTEVNTAACLLLMTHAFEVWRVHRLTLKTDARNTRSRAAIERLGGRFEGILRSHLPAADGIVRDTAMFSMLPGEWPAAKLRLESALGRGHDGRP
ncbi:MAG TPA: GNAT family N-acetyltransferase [Polyangia bacterium]|nr:GNAT family N-acetyltransferase [Polyangia bacterium]